MNSISSVYKWCIPRQRSSQLILSSSPHRKSHIYSCCSPPACADAAATQAARSAVRRLVMGVQKLVKSCRGADLSRARWGWSPAATRSGRDSRRTPALPAMPPLILLASIDCPVQARTPGPDVTWVWSAAAQPRLTRPVLQDGFEESLQFSHLSHFLLCSL
jgi:hypothetical protein